MGHRSCYALCFSLNFGLRTGLMLHTGDAEEDLDNTVQKDPDGLVEVNGDAWSSLLRRALLRLQDGAEWAVQVGKYPADRGVSPVWVEPSLVSIPGTDSRPGILIDRDWKTVAYGALYNEELVPPGLTIPLRFMWFAPEHCTDHESWSHNLHQKLMDALWVIHEGIENIGGGWSYGFGRLHFVAGRWRLLDLSKESDRKQLPLHAWDFKAPEWQRLPDLPKGPDIPPVVMPWTKFQLTFSFPLLAIHTRTPAVDQVIQYDKLPDALVFRSLRYRPKKKNLVAEKIIPGKALRQALFAVQVERRLRTEKKEVCFGLPKSAPQDNKAACNCLRCKWFGSTAQRGILAVLDSRNPSGEIENISRIKICEHSMQNVGGALFSGEYLKSGSFTSEVLLDRSKAGSNWEELQEYLQTQLHEMQENGGPAGWYRIGATSSCTGQLQLAEISVTSYGE